jgi:prepilin-type N-terminal cleavage/methylation domain-containing protein
VRKSITHAALQRKLGEKRGMTLVEMLVALAVLTIAIMCFLPLAQTTMRNLFTIGERTSANYKAVGLVERLIGNSGANGDYEVSTEDVPLQMTVKSESIMSNSSSLQSIDGASLLSNPAIGGNGLSTFICDSVTAKMVCYPTHIADDFLTKTITLYASGFRFSTVNDFKIYYTDSSGNRQMVSGVYNDSNPYCQIEIDRDNASIAYLTLKGDNQVISFETSPLTIEYRVYSLTVEIDAPTVIMVGEDAQDGNYYYYVTSGEPDEDGHLEIVRKVMDGVDPLDNTKTVTLTSAMNDVEWVEPGEGDDGNGGTNEYGYYVMCGDNGQIRRFWRNPVTGNYGWGGDYTVAHNYYYNNGDVSEENKRMYSTTVDSSFVYIKDPGNPDVNDSSVTGISLNPDTTGLKYTIFNKLYTQTAFTINALQDYQIDVYTAGNVLWAQLKPIDAYSDRLDDNQPVNEYVNSDYAGWLSAYLYGNRGSYGNTVDGNEKLRQYSYNYKNGTIKVSANDMLGYGDYYQLDPNTNNYITLTSVTPIKMTGAYSSQGGYPTQSYTLYAGQIPAVMDLWTPLNGVPDHAEYSFGEWRGTLGIAFVDDSDDSYFTNAGLMYRGETRRYIFPLTRTIRNRMFGYVWHYTDTTASDYALSGICGPSNYADSRALEVTFDNVEQLASDYDRRLYPLNPGDHQAEIQNQNETKITIAYLSEPYAISKNQLMFNKYDVSSNRHETDGVYEWGFDDSVTISDADSMYYEDYDGNGGYFSIAVGYYVGGLLYENQSTKHISVPTVMNNGVVYLRAGEAGGAPFSETFTGFTLQKESNVFNEFYTSVDYWRKRDEDSLPVKNVLTEAVSAGYWRDAYHPLFYSTYGGVYNPDDSRDKYSYLMGHILYDKRLTSVAWGTTWNESPEAMWGASDGTLMSWYLDLDALEAGNVNANNDESITAEFQSYNWLKQANEYYEKDPDKEQPYMILPARYASAVVGIGGNLTFEIPTTPDQMTAWQNKDNADDENTYWDKCSSQLGMTSTLGFISPLDTVEDVTFANDTWVAVGVQGLANPKTDGKVDYCRNAAVVKAPFSRDTGSWVCVRTWYDQSGGQDRGPIAGNCNYVWKAVQISEKENCNIQQITYTNGMWYAVGYIDDNDNGEYDYATNDERAVVFYAIDPLEPCGTEKGWKLSDPGGVGYTQAWYNTGNGGYQLLNIDGVNAVASRND